MCAAPVPETRYTMAPLCAGIFFSVSVLFHGFCIFFNDTFIVVPHAPNAARHWQRPRPHHAHAARTAGAVYKSPILTAVVRQPVRPPPCGRRAPAAWSFRLRGGHSVSLERRTDRPPWRRRQSQHRIHTVVSPGQKPPATPPTWGDIGFSSFCACRLSDS